MVILSDFILHMRELLSLPAGILCIAIGIWLRVKKAPFRFPQKNDSLINGKSVTYGRNTGVSVLLRQIDRWCCILGIFLIYVFLRQFLIGEETAKIADSCIVTVGGFVWGVSFLKANGMGRNTKRIKGIVSEQIGCKGKTGKYQIVLEYDENGEKRYHPVEYRFTKRELPPIGTACDMLYSYDIVYAFGEGIKDIHKCLTKWEIRRNRKYSFYGFVFALLGICSLVVRFLHERF